MRSLIKFQTPRIILSRRKVLFRLGGVGGWVGLVGGLGGLEKLILKLTSASTEVGVEARAELAKRGFLIKWV